MKLKVLVSAASLCILCYCSGSSYENKTHTESETKKFNYGRFANNLHKSLDDSTMGFAAAIWGEGVLVEHFSHGLTRTAHDGGELPIYPNQRQFVASMSKTITAIATTQLLKKNGLTPNTLIKDYLPPDWTLGNNIDKITFRDLMTHMSGIRANGPQDCNGESYDQLRCKISKGVRLDSMAVFSYQNMNFALLRIIIPKLNGSNHLTGEANDTSTAYKYIRYVDNHIFGKCGLSGKPQTVPVLADNMWYYTWPYNNGTGQRFYDYSLDMGAYGWYVSVDDYATMINKLFNSNKLLDKAWRDTMTTDGLGCYTYTGDHGGYIWHNGGWGIKDDNGEGSANSCWMYFPNNVICVVMANSDIPEWFPDIVAHAYDHSFN